MTRLIFNRWWMTSFIIAIVMTMPIWVLGSFVFEPTNENWDHLAETLLSEYIVNSLFLMFGVSIGTLILGLPTAWLISQHQFFGRSVLKWALLLPLAIPAYIIAYTYTDLLEFEGPVQTFLRLFFSVQTMNMWFPEVRSLGGAITMLSLVLFPYVYLLALNAFSNHSQSIMEAGKTLGASPVKRFWKIALPLARPAIIAGLSLAMMESLADFGTVQHFGVPTFSTGIYRTWTGFGDTITSAQLSLLLLFFVFTVLLLEIWSRKKAQFFSHNPQNKKHTLKPLQGKHNLLAFLICFIPVLIGFLIPSGQLLYWAITTAEDGLNNDFLTLAWNTFYLAVIAAIVTLFIALIMAYLKRLNSHPVINASTRVATLGYAVPGTVMAIAIIIPLAWIDNSIDSWMRNTFEISTGLILSGTLVALVFSYSLRFLSVALQSVDAGLSQIKPHMDDSAQTLGATRWQILRKVHMPLMSGSLITAFIFVFVEVLKELPATLILRPFNFDTLSVRAYEMAADERLADAGLPALLIVVTGLIPVMLLSRLIGNRNA